LSASAGFCSGTEPNCECSPVACGRINADPVQLAVGFALLIGILVFVWSKSTKLLRFLMRFGYKGP